MLKEVSIEVLRGCPNRCVHCSSVSDNACEEIMPFESFIGIVDDTHKLGAKIVCLSGGEPFMHPKITDMVANVSEKGLNCYIYTSGVILKKDGNYSSIEPRILNKISGMVTKIIFNVEAATEQVYNQIMGTNGCLPILKKSIYNAKLAAITTEAHFVPMKLNINEIDQVVSLCREIGVSKLSFLRLVPHGRAQQNEAILMLSNKEYIALINKLQILSKTADIDIRIGVPLSESNSNHKCEAANGKINIKYDGSVYPCEVFKNNRAGIELNGCTPDNVYKKSFYDIYTQSPYLKYVRDYEKEYSGDKHCEICIGQHFISRDGGYDNAKQ